MMLLLSSWVTVLTALVTGSQETLGNVVCSFSCGQWTCGTAAVSHGLASVSCEPPGLYRGPHQPAASCLQQHQGGGESDRGVSTELPSSTTHVLLCAAIHNPWH